MSNAVLMSMIAGVEKRVKKGALVSREYPAFSDLKSGDIVALVSRQLVPETRASGASDVFLSPVKISTDTYELPLGIYKPSNFPGKFLVFQANFGPSPIKFIVIDSTDFSIDYQNYLAGGSYSSYTSAGTKMNFGVLVVEEVNGVLLDYPMLFHFGVVSGQYYVRACQLNPDGPTYTFPSTSTSTYIRNDNLKNVQFQEIESDQNSPTFILCGISSQKIAIHALSACLSDAPETTPPTLVEWGSTEDPPGTDITPSIVPAYNYTSLGLIERAGTALITLSNSSAGEAFFFSMKPWASLGNRIVFDGSVSVPELSLDYTSMSPAVNMTFIRETNMEGRYVIFTSTSGQNDESTGHVNRCTFVDIDFSEKTINVAKKVKLEFGYQYMNDVIEMGPKGRFFISFYDSVSAIIVVDGKTCSVSMRDELIYTNSFSRPRGFSGYVDEDSPQTIFVTSGRSISKWDLAYQICASQWGIAIDDVNKGDNERVLLAGLSDEFVNQEPGKEIIPNVCYVVDENTIAIKPKWER